MALIGTIILFVVFAVNVALGSMSGTPFLGDIGEMLVLFGVAVLFVITILQREAASKK